MKSVKYYCSPSVINFKEKLESVWKLQEWQGVVDEPNQDVVFFGLYIKPDYDAYWVHTGKKYVFWCGSDITNLLNEWEFQRRVRLFPDAEHYCENEVEQKELASVGIKAKIVQSFLDDIKKFPVSFKPSENPHVFMSGHPNREDEYGFGLAVKLAEKLPEFTFHLYGAGQRGRLNNIIFHGKVPEKDFNEEIKNYQIALRSNLHDGFSEILAKGILLGQVCVSRIKYPHILNYSNEEELIKILKEARFVKKPNIVGRNYYIKTLNNFPFLKR
jgi:hypothetical protein